MTSEVFVWIHLPAQDQPTLAGRVRREVTPGGDTGRFVYGKRYLSNPAAVPVDPVALPLREEEFVTTLLSGHFSALLDAGPDSWGKRLAALEHGQQDELGYLLCTRGDQAGALSFSASADTAPATGRSFDFSSMEELSEAASLADQGAPLKTRHLKLLQAGTGGARPKFSIIKDGVLWLAKLESIKDQGLPSNVPQLEAATLDLAALAGIEVPEHHVCAAGARKALLVKRFDRVPVDQPSSDIQSHSQTSRRASPPAGKTALPMWRKQRYVSARTVFYSNPELQRWSNTGSYARLAREMARWSINPAHDRHQLFLRLVFNCLVSNTDDHDLNHGLIGDAQGFVLAPAFDIVPQPSGTVRRVQALLAGEQGANAQRTNILSSAPAYGLQSKEANALIDEVKQTVEKHWRTCLANNGIGKTVTKRLASSFVPAYFES